MESTKNEKLRKLREQLGVGEENDQALGPQDDVPTQVTEPDPNGPPADPVSIHSTRTAVDSLDELISKTRPTTETPPPPPPPANQAAEAPQTVEESTITLSADDLEPVTVRSGEVDLTPVTPPLPAGRSNATLPFGTPAPTQTPNGAGIVGFDGPTGPVRRPPPPTPAGASPEQESENEETDKQEKVNQETVSQETARQEVGEQKTVLGGEGEWDDGEVEQNAFADEPSPDEMETEALYVRESEILTEGQPERAAIARLWAARVALAQGDREGATAHFDRAREIGATSVSLIPAMRRMAHSLEHSEALEALTKSLVATGGNPGPRVAALLELAASARHQRGSAEDALELVNQALTIQPANVCALYMASTLHSELEDHQAAVTTLEQLTECLSAPEERTICLYTAATLQDCKLGQRKKAAETMGRALDADPNNLPALFALCEILEQLNRWPELCRRLEQLAALDQEQAGHHLLRAGLLHLDRTGDLEAAERTLRGAARAAPDQMAPLLRLAYVLEARGQQTELVETLRDLLTLTVDREGKAALHARIGELLLELNAPTDAIDCFGKALALDPEHLPALQALGTLFRQNNDYSALLASLLPETEDLGSSEARALRYLEAGDLLAGELSRVDDAMHAYQRALELMPGWPAAFWRLRRLYRQGRRYAERAALLEQQIETTSDLKTRHHLLLELGRLQAGPLELPDRGAETLALAQTVESTRSPAIELLDLHDRCGRWSELVTLLQAQADDTLDPAEAEYLRLRAADVLDTQLQEPEQALSLYQEVLEHNPDSLMALRAAGRLYHRLGRFEDLVELHGHELGNASGREAAKLSCRIGAIYADKLSDNGKAIEALLEALDHSPGNLVALGHLERLCRTEQSYTQLVDVLTQSAMSRKDAMAAADELCRAAELCDNRLELPERALELYRQALAQHPRSVPALRGLLNLQLRRQQYRKARETLLQLLEIDERPLTVAHLSLALARVEEWRLDQQPDLARYTAATATPYGPYLRAELLRVNRRLKSETLSDQLLSLGTETRDAKLAAALFLECAQREEYLGGTELRVQAARRAQVHNPDSPTIFWQLQRALAASGAYRERAVLLEKEAAQQGDPALRLPLLMAVADAYVIAGDKKEATRIAQLAQTVSKEHLPSILLLSRFAQQDRRYRDLATLYDRAAAAVASRENRLELALLASDLWVHRTSDLVHGLASLQPALADDPGQADAFARAESLLQRIGDYKQLSRIYSRRIQVCEDRSQRIELIRLNAQLLHSRLGDTSRAIAEYSSLLEQAPGDVDALAEQARLLSQLRRWSDAVALLDTLIETTDDAAVIHDARLHLAQIWLDELHEPGRARQVLEAAQDGNKDDIAPQQLLVRVCFAEGKWDEAKSRLEALAKHAGAEVQIWAYGKLAEAARGGLRDEGLCRDSEMAALRAAAPTPELLASLLDQHLQAGRAARVAELASAVAEKTAQAEAVVPLRLLAATVQLEQLNRPAAALEHLRAVQLVHPTHQQTALLVARCEEEQGQREAAADGYRRLLADDLRCTEAARGLTRLMGLLGHPSVGASAAALLQLQGVASASEIEQIRSQERKGAPAGQLRVEDLALPSALSGVRTVVQQLHPHLGGIHKLELQNPLPTGHPVATAAQRVAEAMGVSSLKVAIEQPVWPSGAPLPAGWRPLALTGVGSPVMLRISEELAAEPLSPRFRFWVGRALAAAASGGTLLDRLRDEDLTDMFQALSTNKPGAPVLVQLRKQLMRALPRKTRKMIEQMQVPSPVEGTWTTYREAERERADRVGLLFTADPRVGFGELLSQLGGGLETTRMARLVEFSLSDSYATLYRALWSTRI